MASKPQIQNKLPENAYRELKPGETYVPMVPPNVAAPEITTRSIIFGIVMNIIFSMAATYLALKVGQGIETAIPISILAIGLSGVLLRMGYRRNSLLENINILAISTTSGIVAGGTVFTMPAIYILKLHTTLGLSTVGLFFQIFLVPFLGAVLGVLFLVPFRRYFVRQMHGKLPFPEATATNEILATGAGGATGQAWILIYSFLAAVLYNWLSGAMKLFNEVFSTALIPAAGKLTDKVKAVFSLGTGAEFVGLGFIIGVRYASIICAGSFVSWFVLIPLLGPLSLEQLRLLNPTTTAHHGTFETQPAFILPSSLVSSLDGLAGAAELAEDARAAHSAAVVEDLRPLFQAQQANLDKDTRITVVEPGSRWRIRTANETYSASLQDGQLGVYAMAPGAEDIFSAIPRNVGIGGIFAAGLISIIRMGRVITTALREAMRALVRSKGAAAGDRTDEDISYAGLVILGIITTVAIAIYFRFWVLADMPGATRMTIISVALALAITFLFTTVSAWAIATISVTPISGMTVTTIIITAVVLLKAGLPTGTTEEKAMSMLAVLLVGGVVCTGLSMAGTLVTEFKLGYWIGASPKKIQWSAIIAAVLASVLVTATIMVCAKTPGYIAAENPEALRAPQANVMATALQGFVGGGQVPWLMYGIGVVIAFIMTLLGISPLAFALGMYLPMELNTPILVGAIVAALVRKSKDEAVSKARGDKGVLVASGLIAGGAIIGVIKNGLTAANKEFMEETINIGNWLEKAGWSTDAVSRFTNWLGLVLFLILCLFVYLDCRRAKPEQ